VTFGSQFYGLQAYPHGRLSNYLLQTRHKSLTLALRFDKESLQAKVDGLT
jgi:hypothetical protein